MTNRDETLHRLYAEMPNAQQSPEDERGKLWGEVEHTPEYYFCSTVAREIDALKAENERLRKLISEARQRLAKGRALWNGPCHECDAVLEKGEHL